MGKSRTRVERLLDNINDMSDSDKEKLFNLLLDSQLDEDEEAQSLAKPIESSEFIKEAKERMSNWDKVNGLSTGYWDIDNMTMGLAPGELTIVAAPTSQGKSLFCMNIAANILAEEHKVAFVTLEMTKAETTSRFMKIMGEDVFEYVSNNLFYQQEDKLSWKSIPYLIKNAKDKGAEIVFIDHLHYFSREMHDVANELGIITQEFKAAAIKYQVPIVLISHTRRLEKGKNNADINDLRGSSYIAQDADIVLMVRQTEEFPDMIGIKLEKNRNRLKYRIGTEIFHPKDGLSIEMLDNDNATIRALSKNDISSR